MKETLVRPRQLSLLLVCLSFSPALAASEAASARPSVASARTSAPGCAKIVCQRRGAGIDPGASSEGTAGVPRNFPLSVRFGVGAAAFRGPAGDSGVYPVKYAIDGSEVFGTQRARIEGAALSLGVSLEQELSSAALHWGLEERFSFVSVLAPGAGSSIGGLIDVLITARAAASSPVRVAIGPSLAIAQLDVSDESVSLPEPTVVVGGAGSIRWDPRGLPVAFDLTGHLGKSLNLGGGVAYRELQLSLAVPL